jgi:hypothetical protein
LSCQLHINGTNVIGYVVVCVFVMGFCCVFLSRLSLLLMLAHKKIENRSQSGIVIINTIIIVTVNIITKERNNKNSKSWRVS